MVTKTKFYNAVRKNIETMIPDWAKGVYRLELSDKIFELKILVNTASPSKQGEIKDNKADSKEEELALLRLDEVYDTLKNPKYTLADYLSSVQLAINDTIKNNWINVIKNVGLFTYLVAGENVIQNIDKKDVISFEYKGLHVLKGMTPAQNSENTIIINDKIMKELHLTDDMVDELILNTLNSDECEILATRAQSVLFSDLSRATETEDCDD